MIEIAGKYTSAKVFTETLEESALTQIKGFCDQPFFAGSNPSVNFSRLWKASIPPLWQGLP